MARTAENSNVTGCVVFVPEPGEVPFDEGDTVLDVAENNRVGLSHSCGGMGTCGTCRVIVESGIELLPERTEIEQEMAEDRGFARTERLACQLPAVSGLRVRIPDSIE